MKESDGDFFSKFVEEKEYVLNADRFVLDIFFPMRSSRCSMSELGPVGCPTATPRVSQEKVSKILTVACKLL